MGMKPASVSVIIPCFNCAGSVERAVLSVASQTCRPEELILVDDASTDETFSRLTELRDRYGGSWIRVMGLQRNQGPASARNAGWEAAEGRYVAFLDADDAWHPRKMEIQYRWMSHHPKVVLTGHRCVQLDREPPTSLPLPRTCRARRIGPLSLLFSNRFPTRSVMVRRDMPFRFRGDKRYSEDYLLWLEIALRGHGVYYLDLPLGYVFKAPFGEGGLTSRLWEMEKGELDTYWSLYKQGLIPSFLLPCIAFVSFAKFVRRQLISHQARNAGGNRQGERSS
jgi:glycosyltransferase involved in cell wall biosynthesis